MILSVGESLIDFIPMESVDGLEVFRPVPGGSPYNTVIAIARLGVPAAFFSRMSNDMFGIQLMENLESNGVDTSYVQRTDDPTTLAFVRHGDEGPKYAFFANGSADRGLTIGEVPAKLPESIRCIQIGSISLTLEPGASSIEAFVRREAGSNFISLDPNIRPSLIGDDDAHRRKIQELASLSSLTKISNEDLGWLYPDCSLAERIDRLLAAGVKFLIVTMGREGSDAYLGGIHVHEPIPDDPVVDTVGAGDTFHAALLAWLYRRDALTDDDVATLDESDVSECLRFATAAATVTCTRVGADPPRFDEIPSL